MKSKTVQLAADDQKARDWIRKDFEFGAWGHLSRKLLARFPIAPGPMIAMIPEWVEVGQLATYSQGSVKPPGSPMYFAPGDSPRDLLVAFVLEYLQSAPDAIVVCENSASIHKTLEIWDWSRKPRVSCYGDNDVYFILDPSDLDPEMIDAALSDPLGQYGTVVCTSSKQIPEGDMPDDSFLDEIAQNTRHILMPAFDSDGYLIWSPKAAGE